MICSIDESTFASWAQPPSATEQEKCDRAVRMVRKALEASEPLHKRTFDVFAQGSYRNRTNVRLDSDVDVAVCLTSVYQYDLQDEVTVDEAGIVPATYAYALFKDEVEAALRAYFGSSSVVRGRKAFDVHANSSRVDADVVACSEHRRFFRDSYGQVQCVIGTEIHPDGGGKIVNWPKQNYDNGVNKNAATGKRFKSLVRILKNLRTEMLDDRVEAARPIQSYLLECLAWNVPNELIGKGTYTDDVRGGILHLYSHTNDPAQCHEWGEANELKYLFRHGQPWRREQVNAFLLAAWHYLGFE